MCSDGGATAGPNMTPLFQDGERDQLVVDIMRTGYPGDVVYNVDFTQYASLIELGMSEMTKFLKGEAGETDALSICPAGSDTSTNVCK